VMWFNLTTVKVRKKIHTRVYRDFCQMVRRNPENIERKQNSLTYTELHRVNGLRAFSTSQHAVDHAGL